MDLLKLQTSHVGYGVVRAANVCQMPTNGNLCCATAYQTLHMLCITTGLQLTVTVIRHIQHLVPQLINYLLWI